jgi:hypothetical protein
VTEHCIEILRTNEAVESLCRFLPSARRAVYLSAYYNFFYLDKGIIEQEHRCCQIPEEGGFAKDNLSDVTDIANLRVPKTDLPVGVSI